MNMRKKNGKAKTAIVIIAAVIIAVCAVLALAKMNVLPSFMKNETTEASSEKPESPETTRPDTTKEEPSETVPSTEEPSSSEAGEATSESTSENTTVSQTQSLSDDIRKTTADLNVRTGAGTSFDKVGLVPSGTKVTVLREENGWSVIEYEGQERYISSQYLVKDNPADAESTTEPHGTTAPPDYTGVTPKGYKIETKDGVTYVDGVLIANKTYSVPKNYGSGLTGECSSAFNKMQKDASAQGIELFIISGYRSYETQERLYNNYVAKDGKQKADTYSARPGTSEHQTGLAMDLNSLSGSFGETKEGKWLAENCHKYGFIIRYPKDKQGITGYIYEPWHIRYLGEETAGKVYQSGLCLEEYYGITSRYN